MTDGYGYNDVDKVVKETSSGGKFLRLSDGKQYQLRIVSSPRYIIQHWINNRKNAVPHENGDACEYCGKQVPADRKVDKTAQWSWIVIDREDKKVKVLQGPNTVAMSIRDLSELKDLATKEPIWGDPLTWDFFIKKEKTDAVTKYSVDPNPKGIGELTAEEKKLVTDANIDLDAVIKNAKKSEHLGKYSDRSMETAPESEVNPADIPDDLGQDKEDNLPF